MKQFSLIVFFLAVAGVVAGDLLHLPIVHSVAKPFILIALIVHYYTSVKSSDRSALLILGLCLSLAGDLLLLRQEYFVPGLAAFLLAHVVYIFVYRRFENVEEENTLQGIHRIRMAFPIVLAGSGLVVILYPKLGDLRVAVTIYALVITVMTLTALFRFGRTIPTSFWMVFVGAISFMASDSILAVNKFLTPIENASIYIMLTYAFAQLMIVRGLMRHPLEGNE